ncbi:ABC transporter ATP-binding protein [Oscillospiraceae bacterium MB08-C2-2]|nr:ABC transporter ATP-binding protein [Oscillospiraceae bacterium MB08-C2-2]
MDSTILAMENITKVYSNGFVANKNVNLRVAEGEIHALVGENGAGKSTLMKILFGIEKPEEGQILLRGKEIHIDNPTVAINYGIGMVHQHFMLVPSLTVAENLMVGMEPKKHGLFDMKEAVRITNESASKYNFKVNATAKVEDLSVGQKQKVEILKALVRGAKVLILDEPTAVLTPQETKELFVELKHLKKDGYTIIFISHKLNEITELCDRITVMRNGRSVGVEEIKNITEQDISRLMVGRDVVLKIDKDKAQPKEAVLEVKNMIKYGHGQKRVLNDVSLSVRRGEILGIAGVEGNGQKELSEAITGMDTLFEGSIRVGTDKVDVRKTNVRGIREAGVSHISEDRMVYGIVGDGSISDNIIADRYYKPDFQKGVLLDSKKIDTLSDDLIKEFNVKCDGKDQPIRMLSGGNMQKVVAAREFTSHSDFIIANQPTRGIDVGASEFIRRKLVELRDKGAGVLLISADLNEVMEVSDSLIVMNEGSIVAYFEDASTVTEDELGEYMLGLKKMSPDQIGRVASYA